MDNLFSGDNMWTIVDVLIIAMLFGYGIKYYTDPPRMNDGNKGFRMKFMMTNEETFRYGNRVGGILCIILGVLVGISTALSNFVFKGTSFTLIAGGVEVLLIVAMYFILKYMVTKKFGKPATKNPYDKKK